MFSCGLYARHIRKEARLEKKSIYILHEYHMLYANQCLRRMMSVSAESE